MIQLLVTHKRLNFLLTADEWDCKRVAGLFKRLFFLLNVFAFGPFLHSVEMTKKVVLETSVFPFKIFYIFTFTFFISTKNVSISF